MRRNCVSQMCFFRTACPPRTASGSRSTLPALSLVMPLGKHLPLELAHAAILRSAIVDTHAKECSSSVDVQVEAISKQYCSVPNCAPSARSLAKSVSRKGGMWGYKRHQSDGLLISSSLSDAVSTKETLAVFILHSNTHERERSARGWVRRQLLIQRAVFAHPTPRLPSTCFVSASCCPTPPNLRSTLVPIELGFGTRSGISPRRKLRLLDSERAEERSHRCC